MDFVFTDGHAVDSFTSQYTPADINSVESLIDLEAVKVMDWKSETDLDLKRRKQAEFLVLGDMPYSSILGFIVYNQFAKKRLLQDGAASQQVLIRQNLYF